MYLALPRAAAERTTVRLRTWAELLRYSRLAEAVCEACRVLDPGGHSPRPKALLMPERPKKSLRHGLVQLDEPTGVRVVKPKPELQLGHRGLGLH